MGSVAKSPSNALLAVRVDEVKILGGDFAREGIKKRECSEKGVMYLDPDPFGSVPHPALAIPSDPSYQAGCSVIKPVPEYKEKNSRQHNRGEDSDHEDTA